MFINIFGEWYSVEHVVAAAVSTVFVTLFFRAFMQDMTRRPPKTPEDLAREEEWYRAEKRKLEAQSEYEMTEAQLRDQRRFLKKHGIGR